jgi:hypothetical protein
VAYRTDHASLGRHNIDFPRNFQLRIRQTFIRVSLLSLSMDFNYNSRMSQSYRGTQQQQQGRTKKKEEDPDAFMRLVSCS